MRLVTVPVLNVNWFNPGDVFSVAWTRLDDYFTRKHRFLSQILQYFALMPSLSLLPPPIA